MKFHKQTFPNGLRLITIPMADNPSVTVLVMVEAGSKYETKSTNGISHFLEHMVFKGTPRRPSASDISRELDGLGANYNAFTGQEYTGYYAKAASQHLDTVIDIISDMYQHPLFDEAEIAKEKGVVIEEIRMYRDLPQHHVGDILTELVYGDQPAGWDIAGPESVVKSLTKEALAAYRHECYVAPATTVLVSGSFDEKQIAAKIAAAFSEIAASPKKSKLAVKESQTRPQIRVEFKETDQTHLVIGLRTFPIADERLSAMHVLSTVLGKGMSSRLFTRLRDELGICYYVRTANQPFTDHGLLTIAAGVDNSRVEVAVKEILAQCARLRDELVPETELQKAKDNISGTTLLELETSEARAEFAGYEEVLKGSIESPAELIAKVNSVTAADVQRLAKQVFVNEGLNLALIGRTKAEALAPIVKFA